MDLQQAFDAGFDAVKQYIDRSFEQFEKRIAELEARPPLKGEKGDVGEPGQPGQPGKDADPVAIAERLLPEIEKLRLSIVPAKDGQDGKDGKDGAGIIDAITDHEGRLVVIFDDGHSKTLARVVGRDGPAGKDGKGFDNLIPLDEPLQFGLAFISGDEIVQEVRWKKPNAIDSYQGIWKPGQFKANSEVTHGGSLWLALVDTEQKPGDGSDWRLRVKRGRDGRDGKDGAKGDKGDKGDPGRDGRDLTQLGPDGRKW